ncbi:MAG: PilN domain-containing protein [Solirubrobacteraceae bacterium]|nr:PilN domain-containing protein [Solirubrobacteraceae bacterium]
MRAVNLVPLDSRPGRVSGGKSGGAVYGVLGVLVVLLVGLSLFAMAKNDQSKAAQELATVQQSTQAYASVATQFSSFESAATQASQRISTVRDLAEARFDWAGTLRDMSRLIPADTQIYALAASVATNSGSGSGGAASQFRSSLEAPAVALTGCSKTQSTVANLVNQLQAMRRVTNVTLEKSEQAGSGTGGAGTSCTLGGTPFEFGLVVFFAPGKAQAAGEVVPSTTPPAATIASESATPAGTTPAATTPTTTNGATP